MESVMPSLLALFNLGGGEILLILALILILSGARYLPLLAQGLGKGIHRDLLKALANLIKGVDQGANDAGRSLGGVYGKPAAQALTPDNQIAELSDPAAFRKERSTFGLRSKRNFRALASGMAAGII